LAVAAGETPLVVRSFLTEGADVNHLTPVVYFLMLAAVAMLVAATGWRDRGRELARWLMAVVLVAVIWTGVPHVARLGERWRTRRDNRQEVAYRLARQAAGRVYFPEFPLVPLMAEGRADHFSYGVFIRQISGFPVTTEHFRRYVPPQLTAVVRMAALTGPRFAVTQFLPEFTAAQPSPPGWQVWTRPGAAWEWRAETCAP
jgi:hypothetical protein